MKEKYFVLLFFGFILFCGIGSFLKEDILYSQKENRLYAQPPIFSNMSFFNAEYMEESERYLEDQFLFRDTWLDLKFISERFLGKQENHKVLFGRDDYMMKIETYDTHMDTYIKVIEDFAQTHQASLFLIPTSAYILDASLPYFIHDEEQAELFMMLKQKEWIKSMDDVLRQHVDEEIFYRSDHHLTTLGQYYIYEAWAKQQNIKTTKPEFDRVSTSFLGSYARASSNPFAKKDAIDIIEHQDQYIESIIYDEDEKVYSYYNMEYLGKQDEYAIFLDGNHGCSEITTSIKNGKELYIFKDSYANAFIPYVLPYYEKITVIDLRFYQKDVSKLLKESSNKDVLLMYALHNLNEDIIKLSK